MSPSLRAWFSPAAHDPLRSITGVRIVVALIIATHPLYTLTHPSEVATLADALAARGLPFASGLVWVAMAIQLAAAAAWVAGRKVVVSAAVTGLLLVAGGALLYAPRWYVAGGAAEDGHPGVDFNALLLVCVAAITVAHSPGDRSAQRGLDILRVGTAALLATHPLHAFFVWDVEGMREWGEAMGRRGFPFGVPLVWTVISVQLLSSVALIARRLVVPACAAQVVVLLNGIWFVHLPHWFIIGPGENGVEFPLTYVACFTAVSVAFWPRRQHDRVAVGQPASA